MIIEFPAPAQLLNLNDRMHYRKKAQIVAEWRKAAWVHGHHAIQRVLRSSRPTTVKNPPWLKPCTVKVTLPVKSIKTRRDPHNFIPTVKPIIDGLVDAGFWPDDTAEWVTVIDPEFSTDGVVVIDIQPRQP